MGGGAPGGGAKVGDAAAAKPADSHSQPIENPGPQISAADLNRPIVPTTETPKETMTRGMAESQLTQINDRSNVDPHKATDLASTPYKVPESQEARSQTLQEHRDLVTPTGSVNQAKITDSSGTERSGFVSTDKDGQKTFYMKTDDGYKPHAVQDNGKTLQPLNNNGKPEGEPIKVQQPQQSAEAQRSFVDTSTIARPASVNDAPKPNPNPHQPVELSNFNPGQHRDIISSAKLATDSPKQEYTAKPAADNNNFKPADYNDHRDLVKADSGPNSNGYRPDSYRPDARPDQGRSDSYRPDQQQPARHDQAPSQAPQYQQFQPRTEPQFQQNQHKPEQNQDNSSFRSGIERPVQNDAFRPAPQRQQADLQNVLRDAPRSFDPNQGRAIQDFAPALQRGLQDARDNGGGGLRTFSDAGLKQFLDTNRPELHGQIAQNIRMNAELMNNIGRTPSLQNSEFVGKPMTPTARVEGDLRGLQNTNPRVTDQTTIGGRTNLSPAELAGRQIGQLLEFLTRRNDTVGRVPSAAESLLMIREAMRTPRLDQSLSQDPSLQIQRFLTQRSIEGMQSQQQPLTLRPQNAETMRELIDRVRNQDLLNNNGKVLDAMKNFDATRTIGQLGQQTVAGRVLDASNAATRAELQTKTQQNDGKTDALTAKVQAQTQQQVLQPDKHAESKTDAGKAKSENNDSGTQKGSNAGQKEDHKAGEKDGDKKHKNPNEMSADEMALFLANKLKAQKEKELKEKEKEKEKIKDEDKKDPKQNRVKYRVKEGDNLASLAKSFLGDSDLAAAIFHINRTVIPITTYNDKSYAAPPVEAIIWIPSDDDIDLFNESGAGKRYEKIGFEGVQYATAEDELMARFGRRWYSSADDKEAKADSSNSTRRANIEKVLGQLASTDNKVEEATTKRSWGSNSDSETRRANIEKILGPLKNAVEPNGRQKYTVRLGEGLKSISLKHPLLNDVDTWRLLARVNGLSTETDAKGFPLAALKRGMILDLPSKEEIAEYRSTGKLPQAEDENDKLEDNNVDEAKPSIETISFIPEELLKPATIQTTPSTNVLTLKTQQTFGSWREQTTKNSMNKLNKFFRNQEDGKRELVLEKGSKKQPAARLVAEGSRQDMEHGYRLRLEVKNGGNWEQVVTYEVCKDGSTHKTYDGSYLRSRPVNMNCTEAADLAEKDLSSNWKKYVELLRDS